jgi:hypothetical protein
MSVNLGQWSIGVVYPTRKEPEILLLSKAYDWVLNRSLLVKQQ